MNEVLIDILICSSGLLVAIFGLLMYELISWAFNKPTLLFPKERGKKKKKKT